ncbi:hypothetical protein SLE2022_188050 [Rubroshorea leprosula]
MGKKKSAKLLANKEEKEELVVEQIQKQPSTTPKKGGNEIDEIFAGKKRKRPEQEKTEKPKVDEGSKPKSNKKNKDKSKGVREGGCVDPAKPRKRTEDGLIIYTEQELGLNKAAAGGTPLCPFDCDCCFLRVLS